MFDEDSYAARQAELEQMHADYEAADQEEYLAWQIEVDADAIRYRVDAFLEQPATDGAVLEQRHVLHEAAYPEQVAALRRLAALA
ncbi:hypothetical protein ACWCYY_35060 [Kitasatospora sp. NPDC001664]